MRAAYCTHCRVAVLFDQVPGNSRASTGQLQLETTKFATISTFCVAAVASANEPTSVCPAAETTHAPSARTESLDREARQPTSLAVNSPESAGPVPVAPPPSSLKPSTPVNVRRMKALLADHPEQDFAQYVTSGLKNGFSIGFNGSGRRTSSPNLPSAFDNAAIISDYLKNACQRGETAGPYLTPPLPDLHCSGLGIVPKKNGKLCPIHPSSVRTHRCKL